MLHFLTKFKDVRHYVNDYIAPKVAYWATKRVIRGYSGPLFRLQRTGDSAQIDINFLANDKWDTAAIAAFCSVPGTIGTIAKTYDQMGSGIDFNAVGSGITVYVGGAVQLPDYGTLGSTEQLSGAAINLSSSQKTTLFSNVAITTNPVTSAEFIFDIGGFAINSIGLAFLFLDTVPPINNWAMDWDNGGTLNERVFGNNSLGAQQNLTMLWDNTASSAGQCSLWFNGVAQASSPGRFTNAPSGNGPNSPISMGARIDGTFPITHMISPGIVLAVDDVTAQRANVEAVLTAIL
jgi:hypothetical protein